jgi:S-adenosylmethionine hydrolase
VLTGSDGLVEIALNRARAAERLGAAPGDAVTIRSVEIGS